MSVINQITVESTTYDVNDIRVTWSNSVSVYAGEEQIIIYDNKIYLTSVIEPFIDDGTTKAIPYSSMRIQTGNVILQFPPLAYDSTIRVRITNIRQL